MQIPAFGLMRCMAVASAALGLPMTIGGIELALLGGSVYYALAGVGLTTAAVLLWTRHRWGMSLYVILLLATVLWAYGEVGLDVWGLLARCGLLLGIGLAILVGRYAPRRAFRTRSGRTLVLAMATAGLVIVYIVASFPPQWRGTQQHDAERPSSAAAQAATEWRWYGGNPAGTHFSPLTQITTGNVADLQPAWIFRTGDLAGAGRAAVDELGGLSGLHGVSALQATPLQVGRVLYTCTERNMVIALDPDTGRELWRFDPHPYTRLLTHSSCRGVAYHQQPDVSGPCAARLLHGSIDGKLWALDALTGVPCSGFGENGSVSLRQGLGDPEIGYHMTSPGTIAKGVIVVGAWIPDNLAVSEPSGVVRAYDVVTGKLAWAWDPGRPDGRPLLPGEIFTPGTPNFWSIASVDERLNLVYVPTGNASPDIWGGKRRTFDDRYSSSVVALDLTTGQPRWSFQTTHHDLWDYDVPAQPVLVDLPVAGGMRPALIQATKQGEIFVLDRRTGTPIMPVEERPVPQGAAPGDYTSRTQPFSAISVRGPPLSERQMWGITPVDQLWCRIRFRQARYDGLFTPPGEKPTVNYPGSFGAISWGGVAVDERHHLLISNNNSIAYYMQLVPRAQAPESARTLRGRADYQWLPMEGTPYVARIHPFVSPLGIPCNAPPWGQLQAIDLLSGKPIWKHSIGTARDSGPFGYSTGLPIPIGTPAQGGPIATAGGVTFLAATTDDYLRAFDSLTGRELWRGRLPAGGQATPMTFISPASGRQFVVVSAGGHAAMKTKRGDYLVAFALPSH